MFTKNVVSSLILKFYINILLNPFTWEISTNFYCWTWTYSFQILKWIVLILLIKSQNSALLFFEMCFQNGDGNISF